MIFSVIMNNNEQVKISDWVQMNSSVTKVADDLNLSRPTVYKYMRAYDRGVKDQIPEEVIAYFDQKISSSDSITSLQVKLRLKSEIANLTDKAYQLSERLKRLMDLSAELEKRLIEIKQSNFDSRAALMLEQELIEKKKQLQSYSVQYEHIQDTISKLSMELASYEQTKILPSVSKKLYKIQSRCFFEGGRCMVIHSGERNEDVEYHLHLYSKIDSEYVYLGSYSVVDKRNYFMIDDVLLSAPLYYEIIGYDNDYPGPGWDDILFPIEGKTTGMCELKQRK